MAENAAIYDAAYLLAAAVAGANLSLLLGSMVGAAVSGRAFPALLAPPIIAMAGVSAWGYGGGTAWLAFSVGAAALGSFLLYQERLIDIRQLPLWRRGLFNLVVGAGIAGLLALPALVVTMGFSFVVLGEARPVYLAAAAVAATGAGFFVVRAGRSRREEARKAAMEVVETFE